MALIGKIAYNFCVYALGIGLAPYLPNGEITIVHRKFRLLRALNATLIDFDGVPRILALQLMTGHSGIAKLDVEFGPRALGLLMTQSSLQ
jgi:hypothetical protein